MGAQESASTGRMRCRSYFCKFLRIACTTPITALPEAAVEAAAVVDSDRAYRLHLCRRRRLKREQTSRLACAGG
jgi:hypothetical protein